MSLLPQTNLEEYARQCTLQRRRYEECLEQSQQSYTVKVSAMPAGAIAQAAEAGEFIEASQLNARTDQVRQSCMTELLEMPVDPLSWNDKDSTLDDARNADSDVHPWHDDRPHVSRQTVVNPTVKSPSSFSYGAP